MNSLDVGLIYLHTQKRKMTAFYKLSEQMWYQPVPHSTSSRNEKNYQIKHVHVNQTCSHKYWQLTSQTSAQLAKAFMAIQSAVGFVINTNALTI